MTERERWVVYPLLFLALGAALRDKLFDRTTTRSIVCQELTVVEEPPIGQRPARIIAQIGRLDSAQGGAANGYMVVNGRLDTDLINAKQFAYRNVPFAPALQTIMASPLDLLRALQNSAASQQQPAQQQPADPPQSAQPGGGEDQSPPAKSRPSDGEAAQPATTNNSSEPPAQAPLADPAQNQ